MELKLSDRLQETIHCIDDVFKSYPNMVVEVSDLIEKDMDSLKNYFEGNSGKDFYYLVKEQANISHNMISYTLHIIKGVHN